MPNTVTVYRVEHKQDKRGPFSRSEERGIYPFADLRHCGGFPSPKEEGLEWRQRVHVCGVATPAAVDQWFPAEFREKWQSDFDLCVFKVPTEKVQVGQHQVIFERPARAYRRFPLTTSLEALPI